MGKRLYVGNLSYSTTEMDMRDMFAKFGTVADAKPDYEYLESLQKAKAIFRAIEVAVEHPEWG